MNRLVLAVASAIAACCIAVPVLLAGALLGVGADGCRTNESRDASASRWDEDQLGIAATIVDVGIAKGMTHWGWVIGIATAMQESGLRNLPHLGAANDHDSIGVFQQRPSQGWGTPTQLAEPAYQAGRFYDRLVTFPGWEAMSLTDAAQAVQRSAYPDAYAKWTDDAVYVVDQLTTTTSGCIEDLPTLANGHPLPVDTPATVAIAVRWALGQLGTPYQFGGSCTDPHSADPGKRCDCSSLVQQAYAAAGIALPRITLNQVHAGSAVTSTVQVRPGDLIFIPGSLGTPDRPRHVGLYLGAGQIIHAPGTGRHVTITTLDQWQGQIAAIRRITTLGATSPASRSHR